ncbi:DUF1289 domain-containing protein [Pseudooceanicola sp.]|uniref:DUF1289 domain-containing protein n=1 Tax=Pseudooceanicola sp. TaxID=1914328 RepID=UPI0040582BEC
MSKIWSRDEPESPCINICVIHPDARLCTGCLRSIDEITAWGQMTSDERRAVMEALPKRKPQIQKRRGGRSARLKR